MTPWLRPLLTLTVLMAVAPFSFASSLAYAVEPSPVETRAGSAPGEGRTRPGRADPVPSVAPSVPPLRQPERDPAPVVAPTEDPPDQTTTASDATRRTAARPALPGLSVLPLGSGLVLVGLGVAFFAVRLRRV
ncbi:MULTISPECIES: hypothetical protein [Streptomyces]